MKGDLLINKQDAWDVWGVSMGDGFLSAIDAPCALKDYAKNTSRAEHGSQYVILSGTQKYAERTVKLPFVILADTEAEYRKRKDAFIAVLNKGNVTIQVPAIGTTYNLLYTGKGASYTLSRSRLVSKVTLEFIEPNPSDRTVTSIS